MSNSEILKDQQRNSSGETNLPIKEGKFFNFLNHVRLEELGYPFNLKGEEYLSSKWKRGMDLLFTTLGLPVWLPTAGMGMVLMKIESANQPSIITQDRIGKGNEKYKMFKIRSQNSDTQATGEILPTPTGRFLRRSSIDELPQFFNVLLGKMTLVGRRPLLDYDLESFATRMLVDLPYRRAKKRFGFTDEEWVNGALGENPRVQVEKYAEGIREISQRTFEAFKKNEVGKPGMTGLYQVLGRRDVMPEHRMRLDLFYDEHASLGFDLSILLASLPVVLSTKGAR